MSDERTFLAPSEGWKYQGPGTDVYNSRHRAVGEAAIKAREDRERHEEVGAEHMPMGVDDATGSVYAFETHLCHLCGETFLTEEEIEDHRPCTDHEGY